MEDSSEVTLCNSVPAESLECVETNVLPPDLVPLTNAVTEQEKNPKDLSARTFKHHNSNLVPLLSFLIYSIFALQKIRNWMLM